MFDCYMWNKFELSGKIEDYLVYCEEKAEYKASELDRVAQEAANVG